MEGPPAHAGGPFLFGRHIITPAANVLRGGLKALTSARYPFGVSDKTLMRRLLVAVLALCLAPCAAARAQPASGVPSFESQVVSIRSKLISDPAEALRQANALVKSRPSFANEKDRTLYTGTANWLRAEALISLNRPDEAARVLQATMPLVREYLPNSVLMGRLLLSRGGVAASRHDVQEALPDYQSAFRIFRQTHEARGQAVALQSIAQIYADAGDSASVIRYEQQSIDAYAQDPMLLLSAYNNSGIAYFEMGQYKLAEQQYRRALSVARVEGSPLLEARITQNIGIAQAKRGELDAATQTINSGYALTAHGPASNWRPAIDGVAALVALKRHDLDTAAALINRAFSGAQSTHASMPMRDLHQTAYEIFRQRGEQNKALAHLEAFKRLDDEQRSLAASTTAALMNARFNFANQELRIRDLRSQQERAQARFRARMMLALLSATAVISMLLLIGFLSIRRSRNQVRAANETLRTTNTALEKALAAKTEFLATTSHEIRTPLNGILGMTQVILASRQLDPSLRSRIELVHGAGETMKALVDDILDVAKMETGELRIQKGEMDLKRLLEEAVTVWTGQAETKRIGIEFDLENCPGRIVTDEVRLRQIIFNLMSNAIKFTDRGQVRLAAFAEQEADGSERLVIRVADSGIGIPADKLEEIFESFKQVDGGVTRRHGGTGLGLAICRSLARAMGGDVAAQSTLGAGSTFTLELPLERIEVEASPADRAAATDLAGANILMIEPNPLGQGIMRAVLNGQCASLQFVSDVPGAVEALKSGTVDHILAEGSALGLEPAAAGELAAACAAARCHFTLLWREPSPALLDDFSAHGINHVVAKPISAPDLLSEMNKVYCETNSSRDIAA